MILTYAKDDEAWSKAVKERFDGICARCNNQGTAGHHVFRRGIKSTRLVIENGLYLCVECHQQIHMSAKRKDIERLLVGELTFRALERLSIDVYSGYEATVVPSSRKMQSV